MILTEQKKALSEKLRQEFKFFKTLTDDELIAVLDFLEAGLLDIS